MIPIPSGVRVWLATGHTDLRKGFASLSLRVQEVLRQDPLGGHLFCFRGRRGDLLKQGVLHSRRALMGSSSSGKAVAPGSFPNGGAPAAGWRNAVAHRTVTAELRHLPMTTLALASGLVLSDDGAGAGSSGDACTGAKPSERERRQAFDRSSPAFASCRGDPRECNLSPPPASAGAGYSLLPVGW